MTDINNNQYILLKDVYNFYPRQNDIYSISINSNCIFYFFDYTKNIESCKHQITITYKNSQIQNLILYNKEIYDLLKKCKIPDVLIEKHFRIKKIKKNIFNYLCCY